MSHCVASSHVRVLMAQINHVSYNKWATHFAEPIIGFAQTTYEVVEPENEDDETIVRIPVVRKGDLSQASVVRAYTKDGNARSGRDYTPVSKGEWGVACFCILFIFTTRWEILKKIVTRKHSWQAGDQNRLVLFFCLWRLCTEKIVSGDFREFLKKLSIFKTFHLDRTAIWRGYRGDSYGSWSALRWRERNEGIVYCTSGARHKHGGGAWGMYF